MHNSLTYPSFSFIFSLFLLFSLSLIPYTHYFPPTTYSPPKTQTLGSLFTLFLTLCSMLSQPTRRRLSLSTIVISSTPYSSSLFLLLKSWLPLSIWCSFWQWLVIQVIIGVFPRNGLAILFWGYWYNLCHDDNCPTINHCFLIHGNHPSFLHVLWNW